MVLGSVAVSVFFLEVALPFLLPKAGFEYLAKPALQYRLEHLNFSSPQGIEQQAYSHDMDGLENLHWMENNTVHPYLGYVTNPQNDEAYGPYGYLGTQSVYKKDDQHVIVGVFGGSVAWFLYRDGADELVKTFQEIPQFKGKTVIFDSVALGGYKQPQQLLALNYLLSLGAQFDVIINLDGFNDAALPYSDNFALGITPYYPNHWNIYSQKTLNPTELSIIADTAIVQRQETQLASFFQNTVLKRSQLAMLIWQVLDQRMAQKLATLNAKLQAVLVGEEKTYQVQGPQPPQDKQEVFQESVRVWKESSIQMARIATANGARYYHFLQPNQYLLDSKPMGMSERRVALVNEVDDDTRLANSHRYQEAILNVYPVMREVGKTLIKDHGIEFTDLTQLFHDVKESIYIDTCCHYNVTGTNMVIHEMARVISEDLANHSSQSIH